MFRLTRRHSLADMNDEDAPQSEIQHRGWMNPSFCWKRSSFFFRGSTLIYQNYLRTAPQNFEG
jgi:hypothetical protein